MFKLARFLKPYKKQVIAGPIFKLIEAVFELIVPLVMANIIDIGVKNNDGPYIWRMGGLLLLLGVVGLCSTLVCQYFASIASQGFGTELRNKLFRHINTFSYAEVDKFGTPSLITRLTNDVNQMQQAVAMLIRLVIRAPFLAVGAIVMAMLLDLKMSLIFLVAAPFLAGVIFLVMNRSIPFYRGIQKKLDRISLISRENLSGARVIRAFSKQESEKERFQQASDDLSKTAIRVGKISALLNPATTVILNIAIIGIVWYGGRRVQIGDLSQGEIIAFVNYINQILLAMIVIANLVVLFTKASASAARINEVLETMPSIVETAEKVKAEKNSNLVYHIGTMIEIPRAALLANEIAEEAEFFSFGTNDLTQMTFGFSRDDAGKFLVDYYKSKIYESDPFAKLDQNGVGQLIEMAVTKGRSQRPNLKIGICGEHGGDPSSVAFCHKVGMDYVSCSPFRVPIARLAAAQAAIAESRQ